MSSARWINDTENWIYDEDGVPMLCGNLTGARHCPQSNFYRMERNSIVPN